MADLNREDVESRAQSDYMERKGKEGTNKTSASQGAPMELKQDRFQKEPEKLSDEIDYDAIPTGDFIRILRGVEEKLQKTHNLHDNALKRKYIAAIREIEGKFINFEISPGLHKSYHDLLENARQLSLSFRLEEEEAHFCRRIDRHIAFFENVRNDFEGNGKWTRVVKITSLICMFCLFLLVPPMINMAIGQMEFWLYIASYVLTSAAVLAFGIYLNRQVEKRKRIAMILLVCVSPIAVLTSAFWLFFGFSILSGYEAVTQALSAVNGATVNMIYNGFVFVALPVIGIILLIDLIVLLVTVFKNRKLFTA